MFDRKKFIEESLEESASTKKLMLEKCYEDICTAADELVKVVKNGNKIMFIGNGGSAADSQHLATEFMIRLSHDLDRPISGNSSNILKAVAKAKEKKIITIGFLGKNGGKLIKECDHYILIPSDNTQRIQEGHITAGHILCEIVEREVYS